MPQHAGALYPRDAVRESDDLARILALPRRAPVDLSPNSVRAMALVEVMTARLRRPDRPPGAPCGCRELGRARCIERLLPAQAWALWEAPLAEGGRGGLLAPVGVGEGKTLIDLLLPMVLRDCHVAALFVPPGLVRQLEHDYLAAREHFRVPSLIMPGADGAAHLIEGAPRLHVVPYSRLCRPEATDLLDKLAPDTLIGDEGHRLKDRKAAQTSRVVRRMLAAPGTRACFLSGSFVDASVRDVAHLSGFALGTGSPYPLDLDVVDSWAAALDPSDWPAPAGELKRLAARGEEPVAAVGRRMRETFGVVSTGTASSVRASLVFRERPAKVPDDVMHLVSSVRATWTRPDGEEFVESTEVARCVSQLFGGFYYRWRFPGDPPMAEREAWFSARKAWGREMRSMLADPKPHLDSPLLLARAAERAWRDGGYRCCETCRGDGCELASHLPEWRAESWPEWRDVRHSIKHETEAVWVDEYLARDAASWASKHKGVVWYEHVAMGEAVARVGGLPLYTGGPGAAEAIRSESGSRSIVASRASHGEGRDGLQLSFAEQLVMTPAPSGKKWEQLLGRLHRVGQRADEVVTYVYRHADQYREAIDRAIGLAKFVDGLMGANQKLLAADVEWDVRGNF